MLLKVPIFLFFFFTNNVCAFQILVCLSFYLTTNDILITVAAYFVFHFYWCSFECSWSSRSIPSVKSKLWIQTPPGCEQPGWRPPPAPPRWCPAPPPSPASSGSTRRPGTEGRTPPSWSRTRKDKKLFPSSAIQLEQQLTLEKKTSQGPGHQPALYQVRDTNHHQHYLVM